MLRTCLSLSLLLAGSAFASGFYNGENGTATLLQGGAFAGLADDLSAMQHNPAGLAQQDGFSFLLDGALIFHSVGFTRLDPGFDPNNPPTTPANTVNNTGGAFIVPMVGASYGFNLSGLGNRTLTIGLGLWGPPSDGRYQFPIPNYEKNDKGAYVERPNKFAPQRYGLINNDILIVYPTLSVAFEIHKKLMIGGSLQVAVSHFYFRQAVTSQLFTPMTQSAEDPSFDSVVTVEGAGKPVVTGIVGLLFKPIEQLGIGASVRPPISITATGTLGIALGEAPTAIGAKVTGDKTELTINLPLEVRAGVHYRPIKRLGISADFLYQGWQALQNITLTPQDVTLTLGGVDTRVAPFVIEKRWQGTWSVRAGASFDIIRQLSVSAGFWYESSASTPQYLSIDFVHPARAFVTGGVGVHLGPIDLYAGVAYSPQVTTAVPDSVVRAGNTDATIQGGVIGSGVYTSSTFIASAGIRGNFGGEKVKARKDAKFDAPAVPVPYDPPPQLESKDGTPVAPPATVTP